ncbi:MAG: DUF1330 domain-containing protein [Thermoanaerobaculia bacterium]
MPAFVLVQIDVHDPETYDRYKSMTAPSLVPFDGRFVVRGGKVETLEGSWSPRRLVILEFPTSDAARAWWSSPGYAEAKKLRQASASTEMILIEGV